MNLDLDQFTGFFLLSPSGMAGLGSSHASHEKVGVVRGHHSYKSDLDTRSWRGSVRTEDGNEHDEHAVAAIKGWSYCGTRTTACSMSRDCWYYFLRQGVLE